ncbi:MAG: hypothetical protein RIT28_912 [Pseudomonadota bacterium]
MRDDMDRVLIERPRYDSHRRHPQRRRQRRFDEDSPRMQPVSRRGGSRHLSDLLGPLRRLLVRRCGSRWDAVYSELRAGLKPRSTLHLHVLEHLARMVHTDVVMIDGAPWSQSWGGARPLTDYNHHTFFVDPRDGVLRLAPMLTRKKAKKGD